MVDLLLICAFCDQEMFIACPLCTRPLCGDHAHSIYVEHDTDIIDHHITYEYVDPEVRLAHVAMVIKYEVMLLRFQSLTPFCFRLKES
jgi:predicted amidophosphoribosyltransferase